MTNSADLDQLASSEAEANLSGSTLFAKTGHIVFNKRRVKPVLGGVHIRSLANYIAAGEEP